MADKYSALKQKLNDRETIAMANVMVLNSPLMLSAFDSADCILLDKEHGVFGTEELIPMTMQCRHLGIPSIVRVEDKKYHLIAKAIDLGADGIMLPRTESVAQVKEAVDAMHFRPSGAPASADSASSDPARHWRTSSADACCWCRSSRPRGSITWRT